MGPYEGYPGNPILTHRHLGLDYPICNVGHGDLVQLADGSWYMVALASRLIGGYHKNMGRETFIAPVDFSGDWPVVSPGTGRVEWRYPRPRCLRSPLMRWIRTILPPCAGTPWARPLRTASAFPAAR
jgi:alpha-N-arabinofuranosidase